MATADTEYAKDVMEKCVSHARALLALQLPAVEAKNYNYTPEFLKMVTELYLLGVIWRFGEQFDLPTQPRDRAFLCLMYMLIADGASEGAAKKRIQALNTYSRDEKGDDSFALRVGYEAGNREGALAAILEEYRNKPAASAAPYKVIEISKPVAAVSAVTGVVVALLLGRSWGESLGVGLVLGVAVLVTASLIFRKLIDAK